MKQVIIVGLGAISCALALNSSNGINNKFISEEKYLEIKAKTTSWEPFKPHEHPFKDLSDEEIQMRMGLKLEHPDMGISQIVKEAKNMMGKFGFNLDQVSGHFDQFHNSFSMPKRAISLPTTYDPRQDVNLVPCIHGVRNQLSCGSCWAFAGAGMMEDRLCIASGQNINMRLAPQDFVNCDFNNAGCSGGFISQTLSYLIEEGIVSEACLPYKNQMSPFCTYQCDDPTVEYKKYSCKIGSMRILTNFDEIKAELVINGPMMVGFTIYEDFLSYSTGEYHPTTTKTVGGHAVKLLGWGYDSNNKLYWLCQNQWGTSWGDSGFFKILTGSAGIDSAAFACIPDV